MEGRYEAAEPCSPQPLQRQPELRQPEQQRQMLQARAATAEKIATEVKLRCVAALRWVEAYEPDRLW